MSGIEYFYAAHSAFAYLGSARLMAIAGAAGLSIVHRPMDLGRVVERVTIPFGERTRGHRAYYFGREIQRWSEERNAPWLGRRPAYHDSDITLPNCTLIAGVLQGLNIDRLAHTFLESHWRDDADLADQATLQRLATAAGYDPLPLIEAAASPEVRAAYEANTVEAMDRSVFGSPTYFVDGDMFYGQDRLEMVERALRQPYRHPSEPYE